jgi:CRP/FNR family transcriptional activator FtrB
MQHTHLGQLVRSDLLAEALATTDSATLARHLHHQRWEPGRIGLDSHQGCHGLYYVQHGRLELVVTDSDGRERALRLLSESDIFGLECLHPAMMPGGYQVRAITVSEVVAIHPELVDRWINDMPKFRLDLARHLASGIWSLERERENTLSLPVTERLICYLRCGESCRRAPFREVAAARGPLPMQVLARRVGCSAGHLSRAVRGLLQEGVVQRVRGGLQVGDLSRFEGHLCEDCGIR